MIRLELLGTRGCHLCDEAESLLTRIAQSRQLAWHYVDIADSEALVARYGERIPVLRRVDNDTEITWPFSLLDILSLADDGP